MGKKLTDSKAFNIVLAILIAIALWVYVTVEVNPNTRDTIYNIPVTIYNEDVLTSRGLMIDPASDLSVNLRVYGSRNAIARILNDKSSVTAYVDVAEVQSPGEKTLQCRIVLPSTITSGSVTVQDAGSYTVKLSVEKMMNKQIEVRGVFNGTVAEGYRTGDFTITPSTIEIRGPEEVVKHVDCAQVNVSRKDLSETFSGDLGFTYVDTNGQEIKDQSILCDVETVNVALPVVMTMDLPLEVKFLYGGGVTADNFDEVVSCEITPSSIAISGAAEDIEPLKGHSKIIAEIDLSAPPPEAGFYVFPIGLDSALTNDSGKSEATVTVEVTGLETGTFETDDIEIINTPAGFQVEQITQSLQVQVRGPAAALTSVADYQLRVVADLQGAALVPGQFNQKVKVYLDGDGKCGVIGEYSIVIKVTATS